MAKEKRVWADKMPHKKIFPTHLFLAEGHFFYLFHLLLFLLLAYPYVETKGQEQTPWELTLMKSSIIVFILYYLCFNWRQLLVATTLGVPSLIFAWMNDPASKWTLLILEGLLYLYAVAMIIAHLLHSLKVGTDELHAVTVLYILLGLVWTNIYQGIEWLYPGSFHLQDVQNIDMVINWSDFLYFSFTTLTTLGYGDITPVTSQARSLAIVEAITGVIFIGVMVSRSISLFVASNIKDTIDN